MKKVAAIVTAALLVVAGGAYYIFSDDNSKVAPNDAMSSSAGSAEEERPAVPNATEANVQAGNYIDYEEGIIGKTPGTKLLFFHAPWCPQCRALDLDIKQQSLPKDVTIIKVDYDSMQELREKYGVSLQTTIVKVDDNGDLVDKYVAYDYPSYQSVRDNLL